MSLVTMHRSLSRPVALSNAFTSDAWPSSVLQKHQSGLELIANVEDLPFDVVAVFLEGNLDSRPREPNDRWEPERRFQGRLYPSHRLRVCQQPGQHA